MPEHALPGLVADNPAVLDRFSAASDERYILKFVGNGGSADDTAIWNDYVLSNYGGGGADFIIDYSTDGTSVLAVEWLVDVEVIQDTDDQDAAGQDFGTATVLADTPSTATININDRTAVIGVSHANMGSPAIGDRLRIRVTRDHDHTANADIAQLHGVYGKEQ